jgi:hypothetical protein
MFRPKFGGGILRTTPSETGKLMLADPVARYPAGARPGRGTWNYTAKLTLATVGSEWAQKTKRLSSSLCGRFDLRAQR